MHRLQRVLEVLEYAEAAGGESKGGIRCMHARMRPCTHACMGVVLHAHTHGGMRACGMAAPLRHAHPPHGCAPPSRCACRPVWHGLHLHVAAPEQRAPAGLGARVQLPAKGHRVGAAAGGRGGARRRGALQCMGDALGHCGTGGWARAPRPPMQGAVRLRAGRRRPSNPAAAGLPPPACQVSEAVAAHARGAAHPRARGYARMALGGLSRGGTHGDEIRHGILNIMREHGIREGNRPVGARAQLPHGRWACHAPGGGGAGRSAHAHRRAAAAWARRRTCATRCAGRG